VPHQHATSDSRRDGSERGGEGTAIHHDAITGRGDSEMTLTARITYSSPKVLRKSSAQREASARSFVSANRAGPAPERAQLPASDSTASHAGLIARNAWRAARVKLLVMVGTARFTKPA